MYLYATTRTWLEVSKVNETKIKTKQTNKKQNETKLGKSPCGYLVSKGLEISSGNVPHAKSISIPSQSYFATYNHVQGSI